MKPPPGLNIPPNMVYKLNKYIYGLKQANRQWNHKSTQTLFSIGFSQSKSDYSLFTKYTIDCFNVILVYVDHLIVAGTTLSEINNIKHILNEKFSIKNLGHLRYLLGFEITRSSTNITLWQHKYCLDLLQDIGLLCVKPASTPMDLSHKLDDHGDSLLQDRYSFRSIIVKLMYLTHSRPDIVFSVCRLSQHLAKPSQTHLIDAHRIICYLKNEPTLGLFFKCYSSFNLINFADSDWGACHLTRRSNIGLCFFLGDNLISWKTKKQMVVFRSSFKVKYRALANTT